MVFILLARCKVGDPSSTPLTDANGDDIWEVTLTLAENTIYEYKFINGNSWGSDEAVLSCSAKW